MTAPVDSFCAELVDSHARAGVEALEGRVAALEKRKAVDYLTGVEKRLAAMEALVAELNEDRIGGGRRQKKRFYETRRPKPEQKERCKRGEGNFETADKSMRPDRFCEHKQKKSLCKLCTVEKYGRQAKVPYDEEACLEVARRHAQDIEERTSAPPAFEPFFAGA